MNDAEKIGIFVEELNQKGVNSVVVINVPWPLADQPVPDDPDDPPLPPDPQPDYVIEQITRRDDKPFVLVMALTGKNNPSGNPYIVIEEPRIKIANGTEVLIDSRNIQGDGAVYRAWWGEKTPDGKQRYFRREDLHKV